jgi:hypothetical protein
LTGLTDEQKALYFRRSYTAADGLWFMMVEEKYGFEAALELDEAVWKVLPKIQARAMKAMLNLDCGLEGLEKALSARLALEGFDFDLVREESSLRVIIRRCPWHDLLVKSRREKISQKVSDVICRVENTTWASEFADGGSEIGWERAERICRGADRCVMRFGR